MADVTSSGVPTLIVCDDLENDENVNTPEQRKKLRDWFYKAVSKAGDTYTDIVYIGTLLHFDALLANVAKNPSYKSVRYQGVISFATNGELWDAWESIFTDLSNDNRQEDALEFFQANREAMLEGTAVLWEEKLSYYDLMVIRISEGEASFNSEIQNDPIDPEKLAPSKKSGLTFGTTRARHSQTSPTRSFSSSARTTHRWARTRSRTPAPSSHWRRTRRRAISMS